MKSLVETIIDKKIKQGQFFDAHSVINFLIKNYNTEYVQYLKDDTDVANYHSQISKMIATFGKSSLTRMGESWSAHINDGFGPNVCWKKN